jgi:hypothetical protein
MDEMFARIWENLGGRIGGPLTLRLVLQPLIATILAIRAGIQDARTGRPPYFWTILANPADRAELLHEGWKSVAKVFVMAAIIDTVYQVMVFRWVYPFEAVLVAFLLACVPYLLTRGPANRIARIGSQPRRPASPGVNQL